MNSQILTDSINKGLQLDSERFSTEKKPSVILEKLAGLTKREREILYFLCSDSSRELISNQLMSSHNDIDAHIANILLKLQVGSVQELMALLITSGINHKGGVFC